MMRRVGIVGGIAPESTVEYYRLILARHRARSGGVANPSIIINSIDVAKTLSLAANDPEALTTYIVVEIERLVRAGADFAVIASNTPHIVFEGVQGRVSSPMIRLVEGAGDTPEPRGLKRVHLVRRRLLVPATP